MRIAVCDDETAVRNDLVARIRALDNGARIEAYADGEETLRAAPFDLLFLDVALERASGVEIARRLRELETEKRLSRSILVFVTAHADYMPDAFDVHAFQYLLKPVDDAALREVYLHACEELRARHANINAADMASSRAASPMTIKSGAVTRTVFPDQILYVESENKKVRLHIAPDAASPLTHTEAIETYARMNDMERALGASFFRCHRCYLVNLRRIRAYRADAIVLENGDEILLAQKKYAVFVKTYLRFLKTQGADA